ncbi:GntR family transcriptional regulator [Bradyrhizobium sp. INPA03-11B]|uniref:GntR family transcriptional regulator n=1 Tax=Bradyrhizobium sp. INPA03-11B TaxID=418598 RepID=UPI00338D76C3
MKVRTASGSRAKPIARTNTHGSSVTKSPIGRPKARLGSGEREIAPPVQRQSLADKAYAELRRRIVTLELAPGTWFKEREIAVETGFGAMPLREALDRLEQDGLVQVVSRRGTLVTPMTVKYIRDFFDVWRPLVISLCRMACTRATEDQIHEITRDIEELERTLNRSERDPKVLELTMGLFDKTIAAADNEHFAVIWRRLSGINERIFRAALGKDPGISRSLVVQGRQADAWRSRDVDSVTELAEQYIATARASVLRLL